MEYEAVIGLEVHAELATSSKMFCACPVVDVTQAQPNTAVCPVCAGLPGVLPVVNRRAVDCEIPSRSIFARKNYFYPDLPKGYQISQYEQPLAHNGRLLIITLQGEREVCIRRVHLEEDTGKLTHVTNNGQSYSLVDLNRAGVPLLEIVSEPDLHNAEEVRQYAMTLRSLMRYLGVNSGDMQKGVLRIEPNISIRECGVENLGTRTEIKNLNSFRALERAVDFEIQRQIGLLRRGKKVRQETRGWDDRRGVTFSQRSKEEAHDYRYFPEPDLPPLVVENAWIEQVRSSLPELPIPRMIRFEKDYALNRYDAGVLTAEREVAEYFEAVLSCNRTLFPKVVANWVSGELFGLMNQAGLDFPPQPIPPASLAQLLAILGKEEINQGTAKAVLTEMFETGKTALEVISERGLSQVSDTEKVAAWVHQVLQQNPDQVQAYLNGKRNMLRWLFGQVMHLAGGRANPQIVQQELESQLDSRKLS
jgi:aspartyl-tRNA(Asn)/glutamyl-tRNA(Gln) amidotransferase subunit B